MLTLISFLGGGAFRLIFGGVMEYLNKRQEHQQELDRLRLQDEIEDRRAERQASIIRLQSELNIKEVQVAGDIAIEKAAADAFAEAVKATAVKTGIGWVDAWNAAIRPCGASISLLIWTVSMILAFWVAMNAIDQLSAANTVKAVHDSLSEFDRTLISAFLGVFVGERIHKRMGR